MPEPKRSALVLGGAVVGYHLAASSRNPPEKKTRVLIPRAGMEPGSEDWGVGCIPQLDFGASVLTGPEKSGHH